jgi:hypothetical protein
MRKIPTAEGCRNANKSPATLVSILEPTRFRHKLGPIQGQVACGDRVEDDGMSQAISTTPRRSARIFHKMRVQAQGRGHNGRKFRETCQTVVVNDHGGLLLLKHEIDNGEMLVLTNPETLEEQECRVVFQGDAGNNGQRVGIEFLTPAPHFWGLEFAEQAPKENDGPPAVH